MIHDPVAFFCEHAARHLAVGPHEDPWTAASAVFDRGYPYGMPMMEYARKTLEQGRRAQAANRRRMLAELARCQIADALVSGELGGATAVERETLRELRDASRARSTARQLPAKRRPARSLSHAAAGAPTRSATCAGRAALWSSDGCTRTISGR